MTYESGVRTGAAGNQAAMVLQGIGARGDLSTDQIGDLYADLIHQFVTAMDAAEAGLGQLGATPVSPHPQQIPAAAPAYQALAAVPPLQAAPAAPAPAPMPGVADGDPQLHALWTQFFADPSAWYDNRASKQNPKAPDFKAKNIPEPGGGSYNGKPNMAGLWIADKKNPSWVPMALQTAGM